MLNVPNIRLLNQQLAAPQFTDPHEVVRWFGFMQGQEQRMMRWAVAMRTKKPSLKKFTEDYDASRIVRTHLFRCTWQLVCADDLRWMLSLCGERNRKTVKGWMAQYGRTVPDEEEYQDAREAIRTILQGRRDITRDDLLHQMSVMGVKGDEGRHTAHLYFAESDGTICSGQLHPKAKGTYMLVDDFIPPTDIPSREECLAELARRYFRSHSPATLEDFVWWTALPQSDCRKAIQSIASELAEYKKYDLTLYLHQACRTRGCRESYILLPSYDEYLIGYKSRHLVLDEAFAHRAHDKKGIFRPVILHRGQVVGNWHLKSHETEFFYPEEQTDMTAYLKQYAKAML